jgi:hypothetical protein
MLSVGYDARRRYRPEKALLYQLVEQHYPAFREMRAVAGRSLPDTALGAVTTGYNLLGEMANERSFISQRVTVPGDY